MDFKKANILSKYKACLVGGVLGDCLGSPFEMQGFVKLSSLMKYFDSVDQGSCEEEEYTDDTAMARQVAESLISEKKVNQQDLAKRFTEEYFREPWRGYGGSVGIVFNKLKENKFKDPTGPASKQFDGSGSYGNGGAMRIAPAALFGEKLESDDFDEMVKKICLITHSHTDALNGAIMLAAAIRIALKLDPSQKFEKDRFIDQLIEHMKKQESSKTDKSPPSKAKRLSVEQPQPYCCKLEKIKEFLQEDREPVTREEVVDALGNDVSALGSVPAAIYAFLRAFTLISDVQRENAFERTIIYAISLGGDTDTIATMAGALAGAYYGMDHIRLTWQSVCEGLQDALKYGTQMYELNYPDDKQQKK